MSLMMRGVTAFGSNHTGKWYDCINSAKYCGRGRRSKLVMQVRAQLPSSSHASTTMDEYHEVLRVSHAASRHDIKAAYRRLALQYHPDVCKEKDCELKFRQIKNAYECLKKRREEQEEEWQSCYRDEEDLAELGWEGLFGVGDEDWEEWMGFEGGVPEHSFGFQNI